MAKEIVFNKSEIGIEDVVKNDLIYSMKDDSISGMIVYNKKEGGYIHQISCSCGSCGYFETIKECIEGSLEYGHTFFVA